MLPDRETQRIAAYERAPLAELLAVLLRQFKRLLATRHIPLTDADATALANEAAAHLENSTPLSERAIAVREALADFVMESEQVLTGWNFTFAQSLETDMNAIPGWETTADFLELAEAKANAELRISTGSALLVALGDNRFAQHLQTLIDRADRTGETDLDVVIARRVLNLSK